MNRREALFGTAAAITAAQSVNAQVLAPGRAGAAPPPRDWIDPDTGHRIVRISNVAGSGALYFHQNGYLPEGDKLIITEPGGISAVDLKTWRIEPLVRDENARLLFTGRRSRKVYYAKAVTPGAFGGATEIWTVDADSKAVRKAATIEKGSIGSVNADETLLLGQVEERERPLQPGQTQNRGRDNRFDQANYQALGPDGKPLTFAEAKEVRLNERLESRIPMEIFTIDLRTGERKVVHAATDWLNHIQFSPTDPGQIMFCHEGPWHKVDRIWTIRTEPGSKPVKVHTRTMNMEIYGHEFWAPDGRSIWYDLQTPRGQKFWLANYDLKTGKRTWYHHERDEWSVHYNASHDGKLFAGDGGDEEMVAHAKDGKWIYLFRPEAIPDVAGIHAPNSESLISPGLLRSERLVNMKAHDYRLEPNVTFTPDNKWVVFNSNMHGERHVYAVEVAKAR
jgi:oligogalacturonide lyase